MASFEEPDENQGLDTEKEYLVEWTVHYEGSYQITAVSQDAAERFVLSLSAGELLMNADDIETTVIWSEEL